jgi:hypothetical protein
MQETGAAENRQQKILRWKPGGKVVDGGRKRAPGGKRVTLIANQSRILGPLPD